MQKNILVVDDEQDICLLIKDILEEQNYNVQTALNSQEALEKIDKTLPDLVILDVWLKNSHMDGIGILEFLKKKAPFVPAVVISGHSTLEIAKKS